MVLQIGKRQSMAIDFGVWQSDTCTSELDAGLYRLLGQTYGRRKVMDIYKEGEPIHKVATLYRKMNYARTFGTTAALSALAVAVHAATAATSGRLGILTGYLAWNSMFAM